MSLRAQLRFATQPVHKNLDLIFNFLDLTDPDDYRCFLTAHSMVLPGCEARLAASGADDLIPDWQHRVRTPALTDDLLAVGAKLWATLPTSAPLKPAALFGSMYVLEGSRLGGALLARRVQNNTDPRCRQAVRYLRHGFGLLLWPSFVASLEDAICVRDDVDVAIASALEVFHLFEDAARLVTCGKIGKCRSRSSVADASEL